MRTDNGFEPDMGEVARVVDSAEILVIRFPLFEDRLLIVFRCHDDAGPYIQVVPPVGGFEERVRFLRAVRPQFAVPQQIMVLQWPRTIQGLLDAGVLQLIVDRLVRTGYNIAPQVRRAVETLARMEKDATLAAVLGVGYKPLWERSTAGRSGS
jgi:hypothetical protein